MYYCDVIVEVEDFVEMVGDEEDCGVFVMKFVGDGEELFDFDVV